MVLVIFKNLILNLVFFVEQFVSLKFKFEFQFNLITIIMKNN